MWGRLFGSPKAVEGMVDGISKGMDKLFYTKEEKADRTAQTEKETRDFLVGWMSSTQGQNLARRLIALMTVTPYAASNLISTILATTAPWVDDATSEKMLASVEVLKENASEQEAVVLIILGFYFAAPYMGKMIVPLLDKMKDKREQTQRLKGETK